MPEPGEIPRGGTLAAARRAVTALPESDAGRAQLLTLSMQRIAARTIWALARLGVADHLVDGPLPVTELAGKAGANPDALYRALRCASVFGIFAELPGRQFTLTPAADHLRSDSADGIRDLILMTGDEMFWDSYSDMVYSLRTGATAFQRKFGMHFWRYLNHYPEKAAVFQRGMSAASCGDGQQFAAIADLSGLSRVADIGGGQGVFLAELMRCHPSCDGVLFDLPAALDGASAILADYGVAGRVSVLAGDFFDSVPAGCDAYLLKSVLHDWGDEDAVRILRNVRTAIGARRGGRLFILDRVAGQAGAQDPAWLLDIDMLVVMGGRERSLDDWQELTATAGFAIANTIGARTWSAIECRPS